MSPACVHTVCTPLESPVTAGDSERRAVYQAEGPTCGFDRHVAARMAHHERRAHGLPLDALLGHALDHAADVAVRARLAGRELDRAGLHSISGALHEAEILAAGAWQRLDAALGTARRQQEAAAQCV